MPRLVGLSRRQVVYLAERGIVTPSVRGSSGRGSATLYSHHDLLVMATLRRLLEVTRSELGSRQAAVVAEALAAVEGQPLAERFLVFDAEDCYVIEGAGNVAELARSSSALLLLALEPISDRLSRELLRAGRTVAPAGQRRETASGVMARTGRQAGSSLDRLSSSPYLPGTEPEDGR